MTGTTQAARTAAHTPRQTACRPLYPCPAAACALRTPRVCHAGATDYTHPLKTLRADYTKALKTLAQG